MDAVNGQFLDDDTQPGYPIVPPATHEGWYRCLVRMEDGDLTHLCSFPRNKKNYPLATLSDGDRLAIQPDIRYGEWIAARVNRQVGWLHTKHLELVPLPESHKPEPEKSIYDTQEIEVDPAQRILWRMSKSQRSKAKATNGFYLTTGEFNRIRRFLRGISSTLNHARRRDERWED